jgi:hypothetical protein
MLLVKASDAAGGVRGVEEGWRLTAICKTIAV